MQRNTLGFVAVLLALAAVPAVSATQDYLAGSWRAVFYLPIGPNGIGGTARCTDDRVMTQSGTYSSFITCPRARTAQWGRYTIFPGHRIGFKVTNWEPKTHYVPDAGGGHSEDYPQPSGGMVEYRFTSPDTLVTHDINAGVTWTYQRLR